MNEEELKRKAFYERERKRKDEFKESIDLTPVFQWLSKVTGLELNFVYDTNKQDMISFESNNIVDKIGAIGLAFESVVIDTFGNGITSTKPTIYDTEKIDYDKDYDLYYWASIHFSYRHVGGGTNGVEFATVQYVNGEWKFTLLKEKYKSKEGRICMLELIELVAKRNNIDTTYIYNKKSEIEENIKILCKADFQASIELIIIIAICFTMNKVKLKTKGITTVLDYAESDYLEWNNDYILMQ